MSHKSEDYKLTAVQHYLVEDKTQDEVCQIFQCSRRSLMRWVEQYKRKGAYNRREKYVTKNKTLKNAKKMYL